MDHIEYSSTGVNNIKEGQPQHGLIFSEEICPYCYSNLVMDCRPLKQNKMRIRYTCAHCGFVCPIYYDIENNKEYPIYDKSIKDFINNFGDNKENK